MIKLLNKIDNKKCEIRTHNVFSLKPKPCPRITLLASD